MVGSRRGPRGGAVEELWHLCGGREWGWTVNGAKSIRNIDGAAALTVGASSRGSFSLGCPQIVLPPTYSCPVCVVAEGAAQATGSPGAVCAQGSSWSWFV